MPVWSANGYLTEIWDQLRNRTTLEYQNLSVDANDRTTKWKAGRTILHISQLVRKTNPGHRHGHPDGALLASVGELHEPQRRALQARGGTDRLAESALIDAVAAFEAFCRSRIEEVGGVARLQSLLRSMGETLSSA